MAESTAVSRWVILLKQGQIEAAQPLWERYYSKLVNLARARLGKPGADHETVAASALNSFFFAIKKGRFPQLSDRNNLWKLLVFITGQKIVNYRRYENAKKRQRGEISKDDELIRQAVSREPTPLFAAMVAEEFQRLLDSLGDIKLQQVAVWKMEGLTNEEIAQRMNCAVRSVSNKLNLIRKVLQEDVSICPE